MNMRATLFTMLLGAALLGCGTDKDPAAQPLPDDFCHGSPDGTPCDDGSPCTSNDICGLGECRGKPADGGLECDDEDPCTFEDACVAGQCVGIAKDCSGQRTSCSEGACNPSTGACVAAPKEDGLACDDGDRCTTSDQCRSGACSGDLVICEAPSNPCLEVACDPDSGACTIEAVAEGSACDDGDACTQGETCVEGECEGEAMDCSALDGMCKAGVCDPQTGECQVAAFPDGTVCDDGEACTTGEACVAGSCGGAVQVPDGSLCDDEDPCTETDACAAGSCLGQPKDCAGVSTSSCTIGVCDEETGECLVVPIEDPACVCFGAEDGTVCDDGQPCTEDDACQGGLCLSAPVDCAAFDDPCNQGACDASTGLCTKSPLAAGEPCDDGLACTSDDVCDDGVCAGAMLDCSGLDSSCQVGFCSEASGECEQQVVSDGTPCDDGNVCTGHDDCDAGVCAGEIDVCGMCFDEEAGAACGDGDACTTNTACLFIDEQLVCLGQPKACPDLDQACQFGACDPGTGDCLPTPLPDGIGCDDGDPCTVLDVCDTGACVGTAKDCSAIAGPCGDGSCDPATGVCEVDPFEDGSACDDGDPCTVDEVCAGGLCGGVTKDCAEAAGPCMAGACDPETGACGVPVEDGIACDDLDVCTANDHCQSGQCVGHEVCFCVGQPDGTPCDDGYTCTEDDACVADGCKGQPIDCSSLNSACHVGACDATNGECVAKPLSDGSVCDDGDPCTQSDACLQGMCGGGPIDCSSLDGPCGVGVCQGAGECVLDPAPDATPCDDGDVCTGGDACQAGACMGGANLCGVCADLSAGDPCDDADPCTLDTTCVEMSGLVVCTGTAKDCAASGDACKVGICDAATGECVATPKPSGTLCDDGDPCTVSDGCDAGVCEGAEIDLCGEAPAACESPAPNDTRGSAIPLGLTDGAVVVMGWIDPAGESDWYSVALEEGQQLSVETRPHCGSTLDTQLGLVGPDGSQLATADDDEAGIWAALLDFEVPLTGTYDLGLTAYASSGEGGYVLEVQAAFPPPCESDEDCDCPELECALEGPDMGQCVLNMTSEVEPNDAPASASLVTLDTPQKGSFSDEADVDWYRVQLEVDVPVDVRTTAFCGELTDPKVWLYDEAGQTMLAMDADGAGEGHARIERFEVPAAGVVRIKVIDESSSSGAYVLSVLDARCESDADCGCEDQECDGSSEAPGQCVARLDAPEPQVSAPATLVLDERIHSAIDSPYDVDLFVVSLAPGTYDFETLPYCGAVTDTELSVYAPGEVLKGTDEDSGEGFCAAVKAMVVNQAGTYVLEVSAYGPSIGEYLVRVKATTD
jgi:hypothetical protein